MEQLFPKSKLSKQVFWGGIVLAAVFVVLHILFCIDVYDDIAKCYGPEARAFGRGDWANAFEDRIPPLMPSLAGCLSYLGMHPFSALIFFSGLFYIIATFPLFALLKQFLKREELAAWGCLMYLLAPKIIRFSCTGLLNSGKIFFLLWSIWLVLSFFHKKSWFKITLLGIALAGLTLIRGEGLVYMPLILGWVAILLWRENSYKISVKLLVNGGRYILVAFVVMLGFISPQLYRMYRTTGYPVTDSRQVKTIKNMFKKGSTHRTWDTARTHKTRSQLIVSKLWRLVTASIRGSYSIYLILAIIGLAVIIRRKEFIFEYWLLFSVIIFNTVLFASVVIAYRYFTINVLLLMPLTVTGVKFIWDLMGKAIPRPTPAGDSRLENSIAWVNRHHLPRIILVTVLVVLAIFQIDNGLKKLRSSKYAYEKGIGLWAQQQYFAQGEDAEKRRLSIASDKPQYAFWGDADILWLDLKKTPDKDFLPVLKQADFAITRNGKKKVIAVIEKSRLFIEVDHPYEESVRVFKRKRAIRH
ncbi:MAG: glycosyltransferase family 39 protein [Victivallaceae bacterium]|nr:glycosyltransferase family 39 protein [Victivallaceae bacterium]